MSSKEVYRPTMTSDVVFELVDILDNLKRTTGLSLNMRKFHDKLDDLAYSIGKGSRKPAYVQSGTKGTSISNLTVDDLGGYNDSDTLSANVAASLFSSNSGSNTQQSKPSADLTADQEAFLLAEEARMLAEVAGNGAGADNVIPERRKQPRRLEETISVDQL